MTLWADADSLPREVKDLIGRRASSSSGDFPIRAVFVANRSMPLPPGKNLYAVIVGPAGASAKPPAEASKPPAEASKPPSVTSASPAAKACDNADDYIMDSASPGDVLVTRDLPLAARAVEKGLVAINDRGTLWTAGALRERVSLRDHMATLRELGVAPPSPKGRGFGPKDVKAFADALDKAIRTASIAQRT
ncbi:MAG: DUF188 domain-containing protein [Spirochaetes bacterium]|nr:DUF188 domain-containing protein [Spirochaetota bacterium]MBU1080227.1 DUF188 domain-containing protein [Spirochaetota bacterium]